MCLFVPFSLDTYFALILSVDIAQALCFLFFVVVVVILIIMGKILWFKRGRKNFDPSNFKKARHLLLFSLIAFLAMSIGYQAKGIFNYTMALVLLLLLPHKPTLLGAMNFNNTFRTYLFMWLLEEAKTLTYFSRLEHSSWAMAVLWFTHTHTDTDIHREPWRQGSWILEK